MPGRNIFDDIASEHLIQRGIRPEPVPSSPAAPKQGARRTDFDALADEFYTQTVVPRRAQVPVAPAVTPAPSARTVPRRAPVAREEPGTALDAVMAGIGDVGRAAGQAAQWVTGGRVGAGLEAAGERLQQRHGAALPEWEGWRSVLHPEFWTRTIPRSAPFVLALIPAMVAGGAIGAKGAAVAGLGALGKRVLGTLGASTLSRALEGAMEAGGVYEQTLERTGDRARANAAAREVWTKNMPLVGADAVQLAAAFAPVKVGGLSLATRALRGAIPAGRVIAPLVTEAAEEGYQEAIVRQATDMDERHPLTQIIAAARGEDLQMQQALALGGIMGAGFGVAGAATDAYRAIQNRVAERMSPAQKRRFEQDIREKEKNIPREVAVEQALDDFAETAEGGRVVEQVTREVADALEEGIAAVEMQKTPPRAEVVPPRQRRTETDEVIANIARPEVFTQVVDSLVRETGIPLGAEYSRITNAHNRMQQALAKDDAKAAQRHYRTLQARIEEFRSMAAKAPATVPVTEGAAVEPVVVRDDVVASEPVIVRDDVAAVEPAALVLEEIMPIGAQAQEVAPPPLVQQEQRAIPAPPPVETEPVQHIAIEEQQKHEEVRKDERQDVAPRVVSAPIRQEPARDGERALEGTPPQDVARDAERGDTGRNAGQRRGMHDRGAGHDTLATEEVTPGPADRGIHGERAAREHAEADGVGDGAGRVDTPAKRKGQTAPVRVAPTEEQRQQEQQAQRTHKAEEVQQEDLPEIDHAAAFPRNYVITEADELGKGSKQEKFEGNLEALRLLKLLEKENRNATREEQSVLAKYVGWGGIPEAFAYGETFRKQRDELRALLTWQDLKQAEKSVINAHYTAEPVVRAMWELVERLGFRGGRILEPALGTGNFWGMMPRGIAANSSLTGVELDNVTSKIARHLYPSANIHNMGFQETRLHDNYFDLAISNVPFANIVPADPKYNKYGLHLHNYFFVKAMDKVRPGGIVAFVTSTGTMQSRQQEAVRRLLAERADLIGAVRLPSDAFKATAGTEVTTDIIVLRKRKKGESPQGESWLNVDKFDAITPKDGGQFYINEYYVRNPHRMLGRVVEDKLYPGRLALEPDGRDLRDALRKAFHEFPADVYTLPDAPSSVEPLAPQQIIPVPGYVKPNAFTVVGGKLYQMKEALEPVTAGDATLSRIKGQVEIRDAARALLRAQIDPGKTEKEIAALRAALNTVYDRFTKRHGSLSDTANSKVFADDPDAGLLASLEVGVRESAGGKIIRYDKAAIFTKRTVTPLRSIERVDNIKEALLASLAGRGRVDLQYMASLLGRTETDSVAAEAGELIFLDPVTREWQTADEYLSGYVRDKLANAKEAAKQEKQYQRNVEALEKVQPPDLRPEDISAPIGATWIQPVVLENFFSHLLGAPVGYTIAKIHHSPLTGSWSVTWADRYKESRYKHSSGNIVTWGTQRVTAFELLDANLNKRIPTVFDTNEDGTRVLNQEQTFAAREKLENIETEFRRWVWSKENPHRDALLRQYNDTRNNIRLPVFNGEHLELPGMNPDINLRPHQKNAIWRILQTGATLIAHVVGAGKTWTMQGAGMEMRRLGLARKPLYVVPNHMLAQFSKEFINAYPASNLLVVAGEDLPSVGIKKSKEEAGEEFQKRKTISANKRRAMLNRIATGDWDGVVMTYTTFEKLPVSPELQNDFIEEQIQDVRSAIEEINREQGRQGTRMVKELMKSLMRLEESLVKNIDESKKDIVTPFEELGIDYIFVDEADNFKNLYFHTKMNRIKGLPQSKAKRALDMFMKTQYLLKRQNGRGVTFATGTPISNTMAEMFTMKRYLANQKLRENGLAHFDSWASEYGRVAATVELAPDGSGWRQTNRFAEFINAPEMIQFFRMFADVQTHEMLKLPVPALKGGGPKVVVSKPSDALKDYMNRLVERAEAVRAGLVNPKNDNMLKITSDGRKAALDMRLVDPTQPFDENGKLAKMTTNIFDVWRGTKAARSTQIVFCDLSTPRGVSEKAPDEVTAQEAAERHDNIIIYEEIKKLLIGKGIPANEIAFIHDAKTDVQKKALFDKVTDGQVRVLIGSTEKLGTGVNVQQKLIALHHLDCPWRPRDIEQREGRILRQGNENAEVEIFRYVTEVPSLDAWMWQTVEGKARFIAQAMTGDLVTRNIQDLDIVTLSAAQTKAIAAGNPKLMELTVVDAELLKYQRLYSKWKEDVREMEIASAYLPEGIKSYADVIRNISADLKAKKDVSGDKFTIEIGGKQYDKRTEAEEALLKAVEAKAKAEPVKIGTFGGLDIYATKDVRAGKTAFMEDAVPSFLTVKGKHVYTANASLGSLEHLLRKGMQTLYEDKVAEHRQLEDRLKAVTEELAKPFQHADKVASLLARQKSLKSEIGMGTQEVQIAEMADEGTQQEEKTLGFPFSASRIVTPTAPPSAPSPHAAMPAKRREEIIDFIHTAFKVPVRRGRFTKPGAAGVFKWRDVVIRHKAPGLTTIVHEVGHRLDRELGLSKTTMFDTELHTLATALYPNEQNPSTLRKEGIAEFFRLYIADENQAQMAAPAYFAHFKQRLQAEPELAESIASLQEMFRQYSNQDPVDHMDSMIANKHVSTMQRIKQAMRWSKFYAAAWDKLEFIRLAEAAILAGAEMPKSGLLVDVPGKVLKEGERLRKQQPMGVFARLWRGRGYEGRAARWMFEGRDNYAGGDIVGDSLKEIFAPVIEIKQIDNFHRYLVALKADNAHQHNIVTGFDPAKTKEAITKLEQRFPIFRDAATKLAEFRKAYRDLLVASDENSAGFLSKEAAEAMDKKWIWPFPFYREMGLDGRASPESIVNLGSPIKRMKGSERPIINLFSSIVQDLDRMILLAETNYAAVELVRMAEQKQGMGWLVEKVPTPMDAVNFKLEDIKKFLGADAMALLDEEAQATIFRPRRMAGQKESMENVATVWIGGKPHFYQFAPDIYEPLYNHGMRPDKNISWIVQALALPERVLRTTITLGLEHAGRNVLRDAQESWVYSEAGITPKDTLMAMYEIFTATLRGEKPKDFWRMASAGGFFRSAAVSMDRDYVGQGLEELLGGREGMRGKIADIIKRPWTMPVAIFHGLEATSEFFENINRFAEMRKMGERVGWSEAAALQTGIAGRTVTIDFRRFGGLAEAVHRTSAFWNTAMQGWDRFFRAHKDNPVRTIMRGITYVTIPTIALYLMNRDDPHYQELPRWRKDLFYNIPLGIYDNGKTFFFPIPRLFAPLGLLYGVLPQRMMEYLDTHDKRAFEDLARQIQAQLPIPFPRAVWTMVELWANRAWHGGPIVPRDEEMLLPEEQYDIRTSEVAKFLGRAVGVSPRKVDYAIRGTTGYLGGYVSWSINQLAVAAGVRDEPLPGIESVPVIRAFIVKSPGPTAATLTWFYEERNRVTQEVNTFMRRYERGDLQRLSEEERVRLVQRVVYAEAKKRDMDRIARALSELRKHRQELQEGLSEEARAFTPEQRKTIMETIDLLRTNIVRLYYEEKPIPIDEKLLRENIFNERK